MTQASALSVGCVGPALSVGLIALGLLSGCGSNDAGKNGGPLALGQKVPFPTNGWTLRTPEQMGMDSSILDGARKYAFEFDGDSDGVPDMNTESVVVIRGGALVAEWYAPGADANSWSASWSMAKSFTSTLIGIAIDEGLIPSVDVPLETYITEWAGQPRGQITLRSVLWMQSGLHFEENYGSLSAEVVQLSMSADTQAFVLGLQPDVPPDTKWYYSSGDTQLLSVVIERATGMNATDYARQKLFSKIGMSPVDWWLDGAGHTFTYCCIDTPTEQFAKFGLLFLRDGNWDGTQVVSSDWVNQATTTAATVNPGYAYQWWLDESVQAIPIHDMFFADGLDEQKIFVIPSLDLVIAKNTIYRKPPGDAVAPNGWVAKFAPRGIGTYGTLAPTFWEDAGLLAPVINSVKGAPHIDFTPSRIGGSPNDPALCLERGLTYNSCDTILNCVCDTCASKFLDCDANEGCTEIMKCALATGCRGVDCATVCQDVINANGGLSTGNPAVSLALSLSECQTGCPTTCP